MTRLPLDPINKLDPSSFVLTSFLLQTQKPHGSNNSSIIIMPSCTAAAYPSSYPSTLGYEKYYNPLLKPTFNSREEEGLFTTMASNLHLVKPIISSLAPDERALMEMKVRNKVYDKFELVELDINRIMREPAHTKLTYQFIASFNCIHNGEAFGKDTVWEFRIQNTNFTWTREDAKKFLEFPMTGSYSIPTVELSNNFWTKLTGLEKFGAKESPFLMREGAWQIVHRLVATNINCQPESNDVVTLEDLELMWAIGQGEAMDWFRIFGQRFLSMKNLHGPRHFVGCTSLITLIAKCCGFQFSCIPFEKRVLDIACWRKLCLIARPIPAHPGLTDESEAYSANNSNEDQPMDVEEPDESGSKAKKQKTETEVANDLNDRIEWAKLRKVVVYEF